MAEDRKPTAFEALVEIQHALRVEKDQYNAFGKYAYRNAESIQRAAKPLLYRYGCILRIHPSLEYKEGAWVMAVSVALVASDGSKEEAAFPLRMAESRKGMVEEQLAGSAYSYALKYALMALFSLSDGSDDPDSKDNRDEGQAPKRRQQPATKALESARASLVAACQEYAQALGMDTKAAMVMASRLPEFSQTAEGYLAAAAAMREKAATASEVTE